MVRHIKQKFCPISFNFVIARFHFHSFQNFLSKFWALSKLRNFSLVIGKRWQKVKKVSFAVPYYQTRLSILYPETNALAYFARVSKKFYENWTPMVRHIKQKFCPISFNLVIVGFCFHSFQNFLAKFWALSKFRNLFLH
jgi:hypothetical protein